MTQAKKGGEIGINGEFYKGGQFMANSENTVKGAQNGRKKNTKKQEIAPYCWRVAPTGYERAIWCRIDNLITWDGPASYSKETGKIGKIKLLPVETVANIAEAMNWLGDIEEKIANLQNLVDRWNNGERWID